MQSELSVNGVSFTVDRLLGKGKGGYSYLVHDEKKQYVVKQIHHEPCDYYEFGDKVEAEISDYQKLSKCGIRMPKLLDVDYSKERILKEYVEGETIFELVSKEEMVSSYLEQMQEMTEKLYVHKLNIDYFPTNFIVNNGLLWYIDFECNEYSEEWNFENWGIKYWSKSKEFLEYVEKASH